MTSFNFELKIRGNFFLSFINIFFGEKRFDHWQMKLSMVRKEGVGGSELATPLT
jgi:hypothetical protein